MEKVTGCPPSSFSPQKRTGFRIVFDQADIVGNFTPVVIRDPHRFKVTDTKYCDGCGLSFFDSEVNAENLFRRLQETIPMIHLKLGNSIAKVEITPAHGVLCAPDKKTGHFTVHEYCLAMWEWIIIKKLE